MDAAPLNAFVIDVPEGTFTHEEIENSIMDNYDDLPRMTFKAIEEGKPTIACVLPIPEGYRVLLICASSLAAQDFLLKFGEWRSNNVYQRKSDVDIRFQNG